MPILFFLKKTNLIMRRFQIVKYQSATVINNKPVLNNDALQN
ncbi:hypothetical protein BH09BAC6_BH09BAC6_33650 [soil metagenome]